MFLQYAFRTRQICIDLCHVDVGTLLSNTPNLDHVAVVMDPIRADERHIPREPARLLVRVHERAIQRASVEKHLLAQPCTVCNPETKEGGETMVL